MSQGKGRTGMLQEGKTRHSDPRWVAFQILSQLEERKSNSSRLLQDFLVRLKDSRDRHLVTDLVLGVLRWKGRIEFLLSQFSRRPLDKIDSEVRVLLLLGIYQIVYTSIPHHAAIYETVKLCKKMRLASAASFINGILRGIQGRLSSLPQSRSGDVAMDLALEWSHPAWLVRRWLRRFGEEDTIRLLQSNNRVPPFYLYVNSLITSGAALKARLKEEEVETASTDHGPAVLLVKEGEPQHSPAFLDGQFYLQDAAMAYLGSFWELSPGSRVLELAAAPGGKTFQLALHMENRGTIVSTDSRRNRMAKWKTNMERLRIRCAYPVVMNALNPCLQGTFDRVVIDAPCSSLGVIRRHPEIRWWRREEELSSFSQMQGQMLDSCAPYVQVGGQILYSVCTFEEEETEEVVRAFLQRHPKFQVLNTQYLFPHKQDTDGFFMAKFKLL